MCPMAKQLGETGRNSQNGMIFLRPFFFLLEDSWPALAVAAEVVEVAAWVESVLDELSVDVEAGCAGSVDAGVSLVEEAAGVVCVKLSALPGVIVSTVAELPMLAPPPPATLGCKPKPIVSSPDSLAGVMVGAPLRAARDMSGLVFSTPIALWILPGRSTDSSFCIRATASGSAGGTGPANLPSLFFS